jgi:hypothetical protein
LRKIFKIKIKNKQNGKREFQKGQTPR